MAKKRKSKDKPSTLELAKKACDKVYEVQVKALKARYN